MRRIELRRNCALKRLSVIFKKYLLTEGELELEVSSEIFRVFFFLVFSFCLHVWSPCGPEQASCRGTFNGQPHAYRPGKPFAHSCHPFFPSSVFSPLQAEAEHNPSCTAGGLLEALPHSNPASRFPSAVDRSALK